MSPEKGAFQKEHSFFKLLLSGDMLSTSGSLLILGPGGWIPGIPLSKGIGILRTNP